MLSPGLLRQQTCQLLTRSSTKPQGSTYRPRARAFHASVPRQDPLLDAILYLPHEMLSLIHTTVPWYAALPITALVTRVALVTTAGSWARSLTARYVGLHPLRQALAFQKRDEILQRGNFRSAKQAVIQVKKEVKEVTRALDRKWRVTIFGQVGWTLAQIPIWFAMAESVRQKCGARDGLLAMFTSAFRSKDDTASLVDGQAAIASQWFDPSLATEGMLWFQNLILPDPTGTLPFIVSGLFFANIYTTKNTVGNEAKWPNRIRRALLFFALLIGPVCQQMPAALLLYWGSSTCSVMLTNTWLDWKYPAPRSFNACKRPLQMPPAPALTKRRV